MLKAKNIIIIFLLNYLLIFLCCCFIEIIMVGNKANEVALLVQTAGDMALEQVQATDDFFVSGKGYLLSTDGNSLSDNQGGYKINVLSTSGNYVKTNVFEAYTNQSDIGSIYNSLYGGGKINNFIEDNRGVLRIQTLVGVQDTFDGTNLLKWYNIPTISQLGTDSVASNAGFLADIISGEKAIDQTDFTQIKQMYELGNSGKKINVGGNIIDYYLTPLSLGITYINEDLLQAFYMNNLDLLMRSKYATNGKNLKTEEGGYGVYKTEMYPQLVDEDTLSTLNPINNGSVTLVRGQRYSGTNSAYEFYKGLKPKVEYVVVDMYNQSGGKEDAMLRRVLGSRFTNNDNGAFKDPINNTLITGKKLKETEISSITNQKTFTGTTASSDTTFDHKYIVVAKVTFYADFIIPYSSVTLREMRGRIVDSEDEMTERYLFKPFAHSVINSASISPIIGNYVDIENETELSFEDKSKVYLTPAKTRLDSRLNSDAYCYTTYFAVTP